MLDGCYRYRHSVYEDYDRSSRAACLFIIIIPSKKKKLSTAQRMCWIGQYHIKTLRWVLYSHSEMLII